MKNSTLITILLGMVSKKHFGFFGPISQMTWLHASRELFLQGTCSKVPRGKDRNSTSEEKADCAMAWGPV